MKNTKYFTICILVVFTSLLSCNLVPDTLADLGINPPPTTDPNPTTPIPPVTQPTNPAPTLPTTPDGPAVNRTFSVFNTQTNSYYSVPARLVGNTEDILVYIEGTTPISQSVLTRINTDFTSRILNQLNTFYDTPSDVDMNGKVIILFLDIIDGYVPDSGTGFVAGRFSRNDLLLQSQFSNSNEAELLYMDTNPLLNLINEEVENSADWNARINNLLQIVAHEYQHLIQFSQEGRTGPETWIAEGLAIAGEEVYNTLPLERNITQYFGGISNRIASGNSFVNWDNGVQDYRSMYMLMHYLSVHSDSGSTAAGRTQIYQDIYRSNRQDSSNLRGYRAITTALHAAEAANPAIDLAPIIDDARDHDRTWTNLIAHFYAATVVQSVGPGYEASFPPDDPNTANDERLIETGNVLLGFRGFPSFTDARTEDRGNLNSPIFGARELIVAYTTNPGLADDPETAANEGDIGRITLSTTAANLHSGDRLIAIRSLEVTDPADSSRTIRQLQNQVSTVANSGNINYYGISFDNVYFRQFTSPILFGINDYIHYFENPQLIVNPAGQIPAISQVPILMAINTNTDSNRNAPATPVSISSVDSAGGEGSTSARSSMRANDFMSSMEMNPWESEDGMMLNGVSYPEF